MKTYMIKLVQNGQIVSEGFGYGQSAMEAFENSVDNGSVFMPNEENVTVTVASTMSGLAVKFEACRLKV